MARVNIGKISQRRSGRADSPTPPVLTCLPVGERPIRRLAQLLGGLVLYGLSMSVLVRAALGVNPWSVLYEGLQHQTSLSFGTISAVVGLLVLLGWIPLRQKPTLGTVANIAVLAVASDLGLALIPAVTTLAGQMMLLLLGIALNGFAVAVYVGARFGPGPRDGLMTGLSHRTGGSVRLVRTLLEVTVLLVGWALGGRAGVGTLLYALLVGPITQFFLPRFAYRGRRAAQAAEVHTVGAAEKLERAV